jgi:type I restriction enzyme M protein
MKEVGKSNYIQGDSINNWLAEENEFDLIIANPPYGFRLLRNIMGNFGRIPNAEHFLIEKGIESINENGKLIVAISTGFLFRSGSEQFLRQYIVDNDLLEMVISLPGGLLYNTGIPIVVLVINKSKKLSGYVKFIDAGNFVNENNERQKTLNDYSLNSIVHKDEDSESQRLVENETIRSCDYNLNVPRYFLKDVYGSFLGDISTVIRGNRVREVIEGKFVRIRDLKDDKIDIALNTDNVEIKELPGNIRQIDTTCILLAIRWRTFKPTLFKYSGTPIFITPDIVALKIDEERVDAHYLITELHSEYVQEQAEAYRVGSAIPTIRRQDLLNLKIQLPSLQEQKAKVAGIRELSDKIRNLQAERNALAHGKSVSRFNEFASLKHTLGRPRQNILDWADNLLDFFNKPESNELVNINKSFNSFYGIDVVNALSQIKRGY